MIATYDGVPCRMVIGSIYSVKPGSFEMISVPQFLLLETDLKNMTLLDGTNQRCFQEIHRFYPGSSTPVTDTHVYTGSTWH